MAVVSAPATDRFALLPDDQVVTRVLAGDTALFEVLMRRYNERLYRAARAILRDESEAETSCSRHTLTPTAICVNSMADRTSRPGSFESRYTKRLRGPDVAAGT